MDVVAFDHEQELVAEFVELPWAIHAGDARWVPPLRDGLRHLLGPDNPFLRHGAMRKFAALSRYSSWDIDEPQLRLIAGAATMMGNRQALVEEGYKLRTFDQARFDSELALVHTVLLDAFRDNVGFSAIPLEEFRQLNDG